MSVEFDKSFCQPNGSFFRKDESGRELVESSLRLLFVDQENIQRDWRDYSHSTTGHRLFCLLVMALEKISFCSLDSPSFYAVENAI